ncbi:hypothetical protein CONCODRAFT_80677 [Conidiobolus coronatus NRRL 28638]|uniref:Uncharacterized protein n=1 Tax=Conidiobolus coronatus (strain ATCC 28846 / CBS 209.66 / NRRL 28638) TaxID=796925 RepID=A0A137NSX9_CONC2|nr:hypothetical protein CONCODRAFT_80677 [Conidiobolus coronatus NRRL 28638]|eukprot:KXN65826.1 hypothetical protein CONCODRAFT_80677 [Conidiobolus coronatus NRRL 28638]
MEYLIWVKSKSVEILLLKPLYYFCKVFVEEVLQRIFSSDPKRAAKEQYFIQLYQYSINLDQHLN